MFELSQENLNKLLSILGEIPAKLSYDAIQMLANLKKIEVDNQKIEEEV